MYLAGSVFFISTRWVRLMVKSWLLTAWRRRIVTSAVMPVL